MISLISYLAVSALGGLPALPQGDSTVLPRGLLLGPKRNVHIVVNHRFEGEFGTVKITNILPEPTPWNPKLPEFTWSASGGKIEAGKVLPKSLQCDPVPVRKLVWETPSGTTTPSEVSCSYLWMTCRRVYQPSLSTSQLKIDQLPKVLSADYRAQVEAAQRDIPEAIKKVALEEAARTQSVIGFIRVANAYCAKQVTRGVDDKNGKHLDRYDVDSVFTTKKAWCGPLASLFRSFCLSVGIPVREASGYALKSLNFRDGEVNMSDKRGLPDPKRDGNAHVWAEVFLPSVGWIEVNTGTQGDCFDVPETFIRVSGTEAPFVQYFDAKGKYQRTDPFCPHITVTPR